MLWLTREEEKKESKEEERKKRNRKKKMLRANQLKGGDDFLLPSTSCRINCWTLRDLNEFLYIAIGRMEVHAIKKKISMDA